jgi:hypothetical protein
MNFKNLNKIYNILIFVFIVAKKKYVLEDKYSLDLIPQSSMIRNEINEEFNKRNLKLFSSKLKNRNLSHSNRDLENGSNNTTRLPASSS